jgi:hypothetical protein
MDDVILRESVQQCLRSGGLPATVGRDELELELEFRQPRAPFVAFYHLHPRCYAAWELER